LPSWLLLIAPLLKHLVLLLNWVVVDLLPVVVDLLFVVDLYYPFVVIVCSVLDCCYSPDYVGHLGWTYTLQTRLRIPGCVAVPTVARCTRPGFDLYITPTPHPAICRLPVPVPRSVGYTCIGSTGFWLACCRCQLLRHGLVPCRFPVAHTTLPSVVHHGLVDHTVYPGTCSVTHTLIYVTGAGFDWLLVSRSRH